MYNNLKHNELIDWAEYEKENKFPKDLNGWYSAQSTLHYIRSAEVLLELQKKG